MVGGGEVHDWEVQKLAVYYKLGKAFGWSKSDIDKLDIVEMQDLITVVTEVDKKRAEQGDMSLMTE